MKRRDVSEAVEEFIENRKHKTEAKDGKRPQLSAGYAYNVAMWLREFARTFPNTSVCDLTKECAFTDFELELTLSRSYGSQEVSVGSRDGAGLPSKKAVTASTRYSNTERPCKVQVPTTVHMR